MKGPFGVRRTGEWVAIPLDLSQPLNTQIKLVESGEAAYGIFPLEIIILKKRIIGVYGTDPSVQIKGGNATSSTVMISAAAITDVEGESQTLQPPTSSSYVVKGGEDSYLFLNISTAAVGPVTATRARASGIGTVKMGATLLNAAVGETVRVSGLGVGYDGVRTIRTITTTTNPNDTITFLAEGADESVTVDTDGSVGAFDAIAFVNALQY